MRKIIAKRLAESKATVPHYYLTGECTIDDLMSMRKKLKKELEINVSVNDIVIKSAALALKDVPIANSKFDVKSSTIKAGSTVDISVAVATPNGLITPIVTNAVGSFSLQTQKILDLFISSISSFHPQDKRGLKDINATVKDLATRAKDGKLKSEEYQGGSFTISNLGMFGISEFSAVINPPQACILAIGGGVPRVFPPLKAGDKPRVVTTVRYCLSADRRVVDEDAAGQFIQVFSEYLGNPKSILL
jgi:pyruvate dehydrogenase E2 component (dihydrolipoamide acetyltransferase)